MEKSFLEIFQIFEENEEPIDLLIRDDPTLVEFSKAMQRYKKKKLKAKTDDENAQADLKDDFKAIIERE